VQRGDQLSVLLPFRGELLGGHRHGGAATTVAAGDGCRPAWRRWAEGSSRPRRGGVAATKTCSTACATRPGEARPVRSSAASEGSRHGRWQLSPHPAIPGVSPAPGTLFLASSPPIWAEPACAGRARSGGRIPRSSAASAQRSGWPRQHRLGHKL
jgi:hypothetical protein